MDLFEVLISYDALEDLRSIRFYIADVLLEKVIAKKLVDKLIAEIESLNMFPSRNPLVDFEPLKSMGIRKLIVDEYIVLYRIDEQNHKVTIERVFNSMMDIRQITIEEIS